MTNLIWKQWQESKFYFCIFSIWMTLVVLYAIAYELGHHYRAVIGSFSSSTMLYTMVAAIVLAARASQGEQADRTLSFTSSLPVSIRRVATVRIAGAILTLAIPVVIASLILATSLAIGQIEQATPRPVPAEYIQMPQRPDAALFSSLEQVASVSAIAIMGGVALLIILSLCGCSLRNQAQVGFLGAVMTLGFAIVAEQPWHSSVRWQVGQLVYGAVFPQSLVVHWGYGDHTGSYTDHELAKYRWPSMGLAIPLLITIARCYAIRYGQMAATRRKAKSSRFHFAVPSIFSKIAIPLPTRSSALVWLELRQSLPLAFYGMLFAILVTIAGLLSETGSTYDFATSLRSRLPHSVFFVGILWAVVVGSSLYSADLDSKVGAFRRTRPIPHAMWFWNKFLVGLAAMLLVMDGATALVAWSAPRPDPTSGMSYAYIACFPVVHALMYALAVLGTCLFRRPLIGGVVAILSYAIVMMAITFFPWTMHFEPVSVYNELLRSERAGAVDFTQHGYPLVYGSLVATTVACSLVSFHIARPCMKFAWLSRVS